MSSLQISRNSVSVSSTQLSTSRYTRQIIPTLQLNGRVLILPPELDAPMIPFKSLPAQNHRSSSTLKTSRHTPQYHIRGRPDLSYHVYTGVNDDRVEDWWAEIPLSSRFHPRPRPPRPSARVPSTIPTPPPPISQPGKLLDLPTLLDLTPSLLLLRFLDFYSSFFPSSTLADLASTQERIRTRITQSSENTDWTRSWSLYLPETSEASVSTLSRAVNFFTSTMTSGGKKKHISSMIHYAATKHGVSEAVLASAVGEFVRTLISTSDKSGIGAEGRRRMCSTATDLAAQKDFTTLAQIVLEDLAFLSSQEAVVAFRGPEEEGERLKNTLVAAVKRCRDRYFSSLEYSARECGCGCSSGLVSSCVEEKRRRSWRWGPRLFGGNETGRKRRERRIVYTLSKQEVEDLDGSLGLMREMREMRGVGVRKV